MGQIRLTRAGPTRRRVAQGGCDFCASARGPVGESHHDAQLEGKSVDRLDARRFLDDVLGGVPPAPVLPAHPSYCQSGCAYGSQTGYYGGLREPTGYYGGGGGYGTTGGGYYGGGTAGYTGGTGTASPATGPASPARVRLRPARLQPGRPRWAGVRDRGAARPGCRRLRPGR